MSPERALQAFIRADDGKAEACELHGYEHVKLAEPACRMSEGAVQSSFWVWTVHVVEAFFIAAQA